MFRIRTADKGRPIIISNRIIDEYAENHVDTLHKKNLFSLGEDRYLTTLLMKNFPSYKLKFTPDAIAHTVAPERWYILLSLVSLQALVVLKIYCSPQWSLFNLYSLSFFLVSAFNVT